MLTRKDGLAIKIIGLKQNQNILMMNKFLLHEKRFNN